MYYPIIIISKILKSIINIIIPNRKKRIDLRNKINMTFSKIALKMFKKEIQKKYADYWIFVPFWPWGDFIIGCSLLKQFKKEHGGKILIFYKNANQLEFIHSLNFADKAIKIPREIYYATCTKSIIEKDHNTYGLQKGMLYELSHHVFNEAESNKSENFVEVYTKMLNLNKVDLEIPNFPTEIKQKVNNLFEKISNGKKVIMISPHANSYDEKEISSSFWIKIGKELESHGYKVVFNTNTLLYNNFEKIYLPLAQQCYFASLCSANISLRSGFTDLITICGIENQIILYPESMRFITITEEAQKNEMNRLFKVKSDLSFEENMYYWTSINNMYNKNYLEKVIKYQDCKNEILNEIENSERKINNEIYN